MKKLILRIALLPIAVPLMLLGASTYAFAGDDVEVSFTADYVSEYVFRGFTLAGSAFQPGAEISAGNFTAGAWYSTPIDDSANNFVDELDLYGSYSFAVSDELSADVGVTLYHYPESGGLFDIGTNAGDASTVELFGTLGLDNTLSPSATVYYDVTLKALTLETSVGHSIPVADKTSLDLGATFGFVTGDYQYGSASGALSYAVSDAASAYVGVNAGFSTEDTFLRLSNLTPRDTSLWFGAGVSTGF